MSLIENKQIFITGGAGFLGKALIKKWHHNNDITVYSRDENKHYFLSHQYPNVKFIVGDIRNFDLLKRSSENHNIGIFAASLKQIASCEINYEETASIIINGAFNSKKVAIDNEFKAACFISSDKAIAPNLLYGAAKMYAGQSFITNNKKSYPNLSTAIYGNIFGSTGSIYPLIQETIKNNGTLNLYDENMTRFLLTVEEAIQLIEFGLVCRDVCVIPIANSFKIKDLFDIFKNRYGLKYNITSLRPNEKVHELMASEEGIRRMQPMSNIRGDKKMYVMYDKVVTWHDPILFPNNEYSSRDYTISKEELEQFLEKNNYLSI